MSILTFMHLILENTLGFDVVLDPIYVHCTICWTKTTQNIIFCV